MTSDHAATTRYRLPTRYRLVDSISIYARDDTAPLLLIFALFVFRFDNGMAYKLYR